MGGSVLGWGPSPRQFRSFQGMGEQIQNAAYKIRHFFKRKTHESLGGSISLIPLSGQNGHNWSNIPSCSSLSCPKFLCALVPTPISCNNCMRLTSIGGLSSSPRMPSFSPQENLFHGQILPPLQGGRILRVPFAIHRHSPQGLSFSSYTFQTNRGDE